MPRVKLPDGRYAVFPDDMDHEQIGTILQAQFPIERPQEEAGAESSVPTSEQPDAGGSAWSRIPGRTLRAAAKGLSMPVDLAAGLMNKANAAFGGAPDYFRPGSETVDKALDAMGVSRPQGSQERFFDNAGSAVASAALPIGLGARLAAPAAGAGLAAPTATQGVGGVLAASPGTQAASAAAGDMSMQAAQAGGAGPVGQMAAGLLGGGIPAMAVGATRGLQSGLGGMVNQDKLAAYRRAGIDAPSLGAVSDSALVQRLESGLEQNLFSSGVMKRAAEKGQQGITQAVEDVAERLGGGSRVPRDLEEMGALASARATEGRAAFQKQAENFENAVYRPAEQLPARLDNTLGLIEGNAARYSSEVGAAYSNRLKKDLGPVLADAEPKLTLQGQPISRDLLSEHPYLARQVEESPAQLNVASLRKQAQDVGARMKAAPTADSSGIPQYELGKMYGALKQDIQAALPAPVSKKVEGYNRWFSEQKKLRQAVDDVFFGKKDNVATGKAILSAEGSQLEKLRRIVGPEGFDQLRAAALENVARNPDGTISPAKLAAALGHGRQAMPGKAQNLLFGQEADNLRTMAGALKDAGLYRNTSNTAGANEVMGLMRRLAGTGLASGGAGLVAGPAGLAASAAVPYALARGMTSPKQIARMAGWGKRNYAPARGAVAPLTAGGLMRLLGQE